MMILILSGMGNNVFAQSKKVMSLSEVLKVVLDSNWEVRRIEQQVNMAAADVSQANSVFLPSLRFMKTFTTTTDPMMAFGTKLGQSAITAEDFDPARMNNPDRISNFNTRLELEQPLINMNGIYGRKAAKKNLEAAGYNQAWVKSQMTVHAKHLYYSLGLSIEAKKAVIKASEAAKANAKVSQDLYEQGMISKADLMAAQLQFTQVSSNLLEASHRVEQLNLKLLQMMGVDDFFIIQPSDKVSDTDLNEQMVEEGSFESRADLKSLQLRSEAAQLNWKSKKTSFVPRVNAFGNYGFNDTKAFGTQANNYMVGVQLRWDLFQGNKNIGAMQKAKYQIEYAHLAYQEHLSDAEKNIRKLKNDLILVKQQIALAELALSQAAEMKKVRLDRYAEGLEKTSDVLMSESFHLQKNLQLLEMKNQYLKVLFELEAQLGKNTNS